MKNAHSSVSSHTSTGILSSHVRWMPSRPAQCPAEAMEKQKQNSVSSRNSAARNTISPVWASSHSDTR